GEPGARRGAGDGSQPAAPADGDRLTGRGRLGAPGPEGRRTEERGARESLPGVARDWRGEQRPCDRAESQAGGVVAGGAELRLQRGPGRPAPPPSDHVCTTPRIRTSMMQRPLVSSFVCLALLSLPALVRGQGTLSTQGFGYPTGEMSTRALGAGGATS